MTGPAPGINPVLPGEDFRARHRAVGGELAGVPDGFWKTVCKGKHPDMPHLLQFSHNGEASKSLVTAEAVTPNSLHLAHNHGGILVS